MVEWTGGWGEGVAAAAGGQAAAHPSRTYVVLATAAVRQWVLSLSIESRYRLAHDGQLISAFLALFPRVVQAWYATRLGHRDTPMSVVGR